MSASRAMDSAAEFVKGLELPLTVLTVSKGEVLKEAEDYLKPYELEIKGILLKGEDATEIVRYYSVDGPVFVER